jgi:hypothetical protein
MLLLNVNLSLIWLAVSSTNGMFKRSVVVVHDWMLHRYIYMYASMICRRQSHLKTQRTCQLYLSIYRSIYLSRYSTNLSRYSEQKQRLQECGLRYLIYIVEGSLQTQTSIRANGFETALTETQVLKTWIFSIESYIDDSYVVWTTIRLMMCAVGPE